MTVMAAKIILWGALLAYCPTLKQDIQLINNTFFADYGELSRHEEYIIHHSRSRGKKSVRVHRQGHENGETLLPRVQSRHYRKSIGHNSCLRECGVRDERGAWEFNARAKRAANLMGESLAMARGSYSVARDCASPHAPPALPKCHSLATRFISMFEKIEMCFAFLKRFCQMKLPWQ